MKYPLFIFLLFSMLLSLTGQQNAIVKGRITDEKNNPLLAASVGIEGKAIGTVSNNDGEFILEIPPGRDYILIASFLGYENYQDTINLAPGQILRLTIKLESTSKTLDDVIIKGNLEHTTTFTTIDIKSIDQLPNASGNLESIIKLQSGVTSNSELSAQYSVRGGSFDENLIYVNDIEIHRPLLVQSAQQEGLSFIDPHMVSSIQFSAGGFGAQYGDKMSSVLDIKYRRPTEFGGSVYASMLGTGLHFEGITKNKKLTHITSARYKTTRYLLTSLDTKGDYVPTFIDFQTFLTYNLTKKIDLSFLGNYSVNHFSLVPENRSSEFGTFQETYNITSYYEGQELDRFYNYMGAISIDYQPEENISLKLISTAYQSYERITYDILAEYYISNLVQGSSGQRDSMVNIGTGATLDHARNYLNSNIYSLEHKGSQYSANLQWKWGVKWQHEFITDDLNEWRYLDSTGISSPYSEDIIELDFAAKSNNSIRSNRYSGYITNTFNFSNSAGLIFVTLGLRGQYWDYSNELLISPRGVIKFEPAYTERLTFHFATGIYYQSPFYKELRDPYGVIYPDKKAQRSIHYVLGSEFKFIAWDRPFVFTSEIYYKYLTNLIPFIVDDVRIRYLPAFEARGFAKGIDLKIYGEFVSGAESWFSLSLLSTKEDTRGDSYKKPNGQVVVPGYYRRPTDQLLTFSTFFQDYLPMNPDFKVHLLVSYGTGLPYSGPDFDKPSLLYSLGQYRRIDIGFSRILKKEKAKKFGFYNIWITGEILNLLDAPNKSSYDWVRTVENNEGYQDTYAVPNYLTGRRFNIKVSAKF